jgi:hypothetical protein
MSFYTVYLRQPGGLDDRRCDPFWEFGSFGSTGCHSKNLMHPKRSPLSAGDRLVFLQGAPGEVRAIAMTPPIRVGGSSMQLEALWDSQYRPLPFSKAPLFIDNAGRTDFPSLLPMLEGVRRGTPCGAVGSKFRSRCTPLHGALAAELAAWFECPRDEARKYFEAICYPDNPWHIHASRSGWSDLEVRAQRYQGRGEHVSSVAGLCPSTESQSACSKALAAPRELCSTQSRDNEPKPTRRGRCG